MNEETKRGSYAREKGEVVLREHEFDGIQEYDQKLPNWWLFTFYIAIVWFLVHWCVYYYTASASTDDENIRGAMVEIQQKKDRELAATLASLDDTTLVTKWATDPAITAAGEATFLASCAACHSADLSATMVVNNQPIPLPGRPLNDHHWEYGGKPMDVFKLINEGTPVNAPGYNGAKMQAWGQVLSPKQVAEVTAFLISKNPEDFKN
ncbi:cbb3-type cytochrome c oxidase N-terminal domain-containing protein [Luteolibacter sp. LG18]|uniref:cbb3-type cytochrome c oxidase N-terminal domain-containing protein n=1 Tax=Luteolibacter sp. LG18 TaxID=2819286 RepID=UPI002B29DB28|nr:hypothetical protein llg_32360 [Luteolibacter sp. LG18]